jgi:DNA-binding Lrp family transcriptional regulator
LLYLYYELASPLRRVIKQFGKKGVNSVAAKAFILIETAVGKSKEVVTSLSKLEGVSSVDTVTGPYDIIAIVEGQTLNDIGDLVTGKIHPVAGISRTVTCLAI